MNRLLTVLFFVWASWNLWDSQSWAFSSSSQKQSHLLRQEVLQQKLPEIKTVVIKQDLPWRDLFLGAKSKPKRKNTKVAVSWENPLEGSLLKGLIPEKRATILYQGRSQSIDVGATLAECTLKSVNRVSALFACGKHRVEIGWK